MKKTISALTGGYGPSASVVDGTLILSLPDAISPIVWRLDLGTVKSSALEVQDMEDGRFMLVIKTPKGERTDIAPYDSRAKAVQALMATSAAMENAHGKMHRAEQGGANAYAPGGVARGFARVFGKILMGLFALVLLMVLIVFIANMTSPRPVGLPTGGAVSGAAQAPSQSGPGVPVPADLFLQGR